MYQKYNNEGEQFIYRVSDGAWIPTNPDNKDYQEFLTYLDNNNLAIDDIESYTP